MLDGIYITRLVNSRMGDFLVRIAPKLNQTFEFINTMAVSQFVCIKGKKVKLAHLI